MKTHSKYSIIKIHDPRRIPPPAGPDDGSIGYWSKQVQAKISDKLADEYEQTVSDTVDNVDKPGVGRILLEALLSSKTIIIQPKITLLAKSRGKSFSCAIALDKKAATPLGVTVDKGELSEYVGAGGGSDVAIPFDLDQSVPACMDAPANKPRIGDDDDMVLVHELLHSLREMEGEFNPVPFNVTPYQLYLDEEEFFAILVENIYISERCGAGAKLLMDHEQHKPLGDVKNMIKKDYGVTTYDWATSDGFLKGNKDNRRLVIKFCDREEPTLAFKISQVNAPFNPIKEYFSKKDFYRGLGS
jgi:hypothetical protein